jgi:hypothetical protein
MLVVMPPDEGNGLFRRYSVDDDEASQGSTGPSTATAAGDLHTLSRGAFPSFVQDLARMRLVPGQPEVGPAQPRALPGDGWWCPAEQIHGEGRRRPGWQRLSQTTAPDQPAGWQAQHASAGGVPRVGHEATLGKRCRSSASRAGIGLSDDT